jgi:helix-turn-helix resolvase-like protein
MLCEMGQGSLQDTELRGENMLVPDEVTAMVRLRGLGWGTKRIAREMGCSRTTVKRYLEAGGWIAYRKPRRGRRLDGLERWLSERFHRHRGNADVTRRLGDWAVLRRDLLSRPLRHRDIVFEHQDAFGPYHSVFVIKLISKNF